MNFGFTNWEENNSFVKNDFSGNRLPFLKLNKGNNNVRIITMPAKYWQIRFEDGKSRFGSRVLCSNLIADPVTKGQCPTALAGYSPKNRYMIGVINRSVEGGEICIFDMSVLVYDSLRGLSMDPDWGAPDSFEINIRYNPEAGSPTGIYTVIPRKKVPLSEEDLELIEKVGRKNIEETLARLTSPPEPEKVRDKLISLGWDGVTKVGKKQKGAANSFTSKAAEVPEKEHKESTEDDYDFEKFEG